MASKRRRGKSKVVSLVILGLLASVTYAGWRVIKPDDTLANPANPANPDTPTTQVADGTIDGTIDGLDPAQGDPTHRPLSVRNEGAVSPDRAEAARRSNPDRGQPTRATPTPTAPVLTMGEGLTGAPPASSPASSSDRADPPASRPTGRIAPPALAQPVNTVPAVETETLTESVKQLVGLAEKKRTGGDQVGARELYLRALYHRDATEADRNELRPQITALNDDILFSPKLHPTEPMTRMHKIVQGDFISTLPSRQHLAVDKDLLVRINRIADPNKIRLGQKIKLITGPFHAEVIKSAYRMDIYSGPRDDPSRWRYVRSFPVGLGDTGVDSGTPVGEFVVSGSKVTNPSWANPNTGERFDADDPENPIGEFWVGITGLGGSSVHVGYGIHGTIDPESIGNARSMGCVRLHDADIAFVYELLVPEKSRVRILP